MINPEHGNFQPIQAIDNLESCVGKTIKDVITWQDRAGDGNADTKVVFFEDGTFLVFYPDYENYAEGFQSDRISAFLNFRTWFSKREAVKLGIYDAEQLEKEIKEYQAYMAAQRKKLYESAQIEREVKQRIEDENRRKSLLRNLEDMQNDPIFMKEAAKLLLKQEEKL